MNSAWKIDVGQYWRIIVMVSIGIIAGSLIIHPHFPNNVIHKYWVGATLGYFCGYLSGVVWHIRAVRPLPKSSIKPLLFIGFCISICAIAAVFDLIPSMKAQEKEINFISSLGTMNISQVNITFEGRKPAKLIEHEAIASFGRLLSNARTFDRSHELNIQEFTVEIFYQDGSVIYDASIPEKHRSDIVLEYTTDIGIFSGPQEILIPGLKVWLDQKIIN